MINLIAQKIEGTDNGWLVCEVQEANGETKVLSKMKIFCNAANNTEADAFAMFPVSKRHIEKAKIVESTETETVTEEKEVTEIEVIDGKAVQKKVIQQVEKQVPVCDELPIVCEKGNPVEDENGCQCVHKVPRKVKQLQYYTEQVSCETEEELQALQEQAETEIEELKSSLMAL